MEDYVKEAPRAGATLMLKNEPVSAVSRQDYCSKAG